jgi:hypothetical protein
MKNIFCFIAAFLCLQSLSAQEFKPAKGPLEGVWENEDDDEEVLIFIGNLILGKDWDSTYSVYPGVEYRNGRAQSSVEPDDVFYYKLSGNSLTITNEYGNANYKRSGDAILRNKGPLEGSWTLVHYSELDIPGTMTWIFIGQLLIMSAEIDSRTEYEGLEFTYSETDNTITHMGDSVSCMVSGDTMTISEDGESMVFTRKK